MLITDEEVNHLKPWLIRKLEAISEADSEVLSDYVLALLQADQSETDLRANAKDNLTDFLGKATDLFVGEVFDVIKSKAFLLRQKPSTIKHESANHDLAKDVPAGPARWQRELSRNGILGQKRSHQQTSGPYVDWDAPERQGSRNSKQSRYDYNRGRSNDRQAADLNPRMMMHQSKSTSAQSYADGPHLNSFPPTTTNMSSNSMGVPPVRQEAFDSSQSGIVANGSLPFDSNAALSALMTLVSMGMALPLPDMDQAFSTDSSPARPWIPSKKLCRYYEATGSCSRGNTCVFRHVDKNIKPDVDSLETKPMTNEVAKIRSNDMQVANGVTQREGKRAPFSAPFRYAQQKPLSQIVVENIPEEFYHENTIKDFFSQFGSVKSVKMRKRQRNLAIVEFQDSADARTAISSPKVIFENRFVKVFWYVPGMDVEHMNGLIDPSPDDQIGCTGDKSITTTSMAEAQQKHDKRQLILAETIRKRQELRNQQAEIQQEIEAEIQKAKDLLARKGKTLPEATEASIRATMSNDEGVPVKWKPLGTEMDILGLESASNTGSGCSQSPEQDRRGLQYGYGRASFTGRSRAGLSGSYVGTPRGNGAYNLDNRPRRVRVEGVDFDTVKLDALKEYLFTFGDYVSVELDSDLQSYIVTFQDRSTAEAFYHGSKVIPRVGVVDLSWVTGIIPAIVKHEEDIDMNRLDRSKLYDAMVILGPDQFRENEYEGDEDWIQ